eukprot:scaffold117927_cov18-Tisochrysis_lutea.AAC.1
MGQGPGALGHACRLMIVTPAGACRPEASQMMMTKLPGLNWQNSQLLLLRSARLFGAQQRRCVSFATFGVGVGAGSDRGR